jgi:hypothetical protein
MSRIEYRNYQKAKEPKQCGTIVQKSVRNKNATNNVETTSCNFLKF